MFQNPAKRSSYIKLSRMGQTLFEEATILTNYKDKKWKYAYFLTLALLILSGLIGIFSVFTIARVKDRETSFYKELSEKRGVWIYIGNDEIVRQLKNDNSIHLILKVNNGKGLIK